MNKKKATGVLGAMLAANDSRSLERTRNRMLLAMKIETAMREKGLSQKQFALLMGKSESEISDWLSGDRNFTVDTLTDIGQELGINLLNTYSCKTRSVPLQIVCKIKAKTSQTVEYKQTSPIVRAGESISTGNEHLMVG